MKVGPDMLDTYGLPYEYGSNMQYGTFAFAADNTMPTMITTDATYQNTIGSQYIPTFLDILSINILYGFMSMFSLFYIDISDRRPLS
jgi:hypothetical protein